MTTRNNTVNELLREIEYLAFDIHTNNDEKISAVQAVLYQWDQMMDAKSISAEEEYFSDGFVRG